MTIGKLIDRNELLNRFPALRGRGKNPKYRLDWLIRRRAIPIVKLGKRSIFFDEEAIKKWIEQNSISVTDGN